MFYNINVVLYFFEQVNASFFPKNLYAALLSYLKTIQTSNFLLVVYWILLTYYKYNEKINQPMNSITLNYMIHKHMYVIVYLISESVYILHAVKLKACQYEC